MINAPEILKKHLGILRRRDKRLSHAIKTVGFPGPRTQTPGFGTLIRIIIDQQVSTAAGAAIWAKLQRACAGTVNPKRVVALGETGLRAVGCSGQKARYIMGVSAATVDSTLHFGKLHKAEDIAVRETLIAFNGIGEWTANIYLMFGMGRPDVWPAGDLALQIGVQMLHGLKKRPTPKELDKIAEQWKPYRSSAAVLIWHYYTTHRATQKTVAKKRPAKKSSAKVS